MSELESVKEGTTVLPTATWTGEAAKKLMGEEAWRNVRRKSDPNLNNPTDEDHARTLRMLPRSGCVIQPVQAAEKAAMRPSSPRPCSAPGPRTWASLKRVPPN